MSWLLSPLPHLFMDGSRMGDSCPDPRGCGSLIFHIYVGVAHFFGSQFEYQISIFGVSSNVKIGLRMLKCDIRSQFECQNWILNVKMRYSGQIGMSKKTKNENEKRKTKNKLLHLASNVTIYWH